MIEQFTKDLQALLASLVSCNVYEGEAPRDADGVAIEPPFVVYTATPRAKADESGVYIVDLFIDVWALNSWANCYEHYNALDEALDGTVYAVASGVICADQAGAIYQRNERDVTDERLRRMSGQYILRFYPKN